MTETENPTATRTFAQAMKAHGVTTTNSSIYEGHRRTTVAIDGETVGWVDRGPGRCGWAATASTSQGSIDRGDWHSTKREAMTEVIAFADARTAAAIEQATR